MNYLRGERSNEINTSGVGLYRSRTDVLGDIIDSSPTWVGPPVAPYTGTWSDRLNPAATNPEAGFSAQTYSQYVTAAQTRMNVVYVGGKQHATVRPDRDQFPHLRYPPAVVDLRMHGTGLPDLRIDGYVGSRKVESVTMSCNPAKDTLRLRSAGKAIQASIRPAAG